MFTHPRLTADYCQRGLPFTPRGGQTEFIRKRDIQLGSKALRLRAKDPGQLHYSHLGKLAVVRTASDFGGIRETSVLSEFVGTMLHALEF